MEISGAGTEDRARHGGVFDSVYGRWSGSDFVPETILEGFRPWNVTQKVAESYTTNRPESMLTCGFAAYNGGYQLTVV